MIHEHYTDGVLTHTEELPEPEPVSPTPEEQAVALANALLADPERLAQLVALIAPSNTAKGPLEYVNEAVQSVVNSEGE